MTFKTRGQHSIFQNCIQRICMDKASVARVCIMFNYKKNIYSLKIFKIMSICCAFSFSFIFPGLRVGIKKVSVQHLWNTYLELFDFPFLRLLCPFWFSYVCCWPWASCFEFPVLDQGQGGQALTKCSGLVRAATRALLPQFKNDPVPNLISLCGLMHLLTPSFAHVTHTGEGFLGSLSHPEETFQFFFL